MRISYVLFLSFFSIQALHAESSVDFNNALSELDAMPFSLDYEISEWDRLLQQAETKKFKKTHPDFEYDCLFPDTPEYVAPGWVCDEPIEGFEFSAVGSGYGGAYKDQIEKISDKRGDYVNRVELPVKAYLEALVFGQSAIKVTVDNMVKEYTNKDDEKIIEAHVAKQKTSLSSLSEKTLLKHIGKIYSEFNEKGEKIASISTAILKLSHGSEHCRMLVKSYVEMSSEDDTDVADKTVSRGQCGFSQVVEDMADSGWKLLNMIKSPGDVYYVLVGYSEPVDEQAETGMENDHRLWKQFKAQSSYELQKEIVRELAKE